MTLTPLQRAILENYQQFRERPPTIRRLFALSTRFYAALLIALGLAALPWIAIGQWNQIWLYASFACGLLLRDFQLNRMAAQFWPALAEVLDWKKVDELVWVESDCSPAD